MIGKQLFHKWQIILTSAVMETPIHSYTLNKLVDVEDNTLDWPLEIIMVTSRLASQKSSRQNCDSETEVMLTPTNDLKKRSKLHFRKYCKYCHKSSHYVSKCFSKQQEDKKRKRKKYSRTNLHSKLYIQNFQAYRSQIHLNEQLSSYLGNYDSRILYDSRICSVSRNRYSHIKQLVLDRLQFHGHKLNLLTDIIIVIEDSSRTEIHHFQKTLSFQYNLENLHLPTKLLS